MKKWFAVIGDPILHSKSPEMHSLWYEELSIDAAYIPIRVERERLEEAVASLKLLGASGFNVTIPHKESIIPFLDELDPMAQKMGAVNTVLRTKDGRLKGYNTDAYGFQNSLQPLLEPHHSRALILGNGGAAKAVCYVLKQLGIEYNLISRAKANSCLTYQDLNKEIMESHKLIINCTPLGTYPNISDYPDIPYEFITREHLLYDLIYNPEETTFLAKGKAKGAAIKNGYEMLVLQAEQNWKIWNHED